MSPSRRATTRNRRPRPAVAPPSPAPGQRVWVLDVPYQTPAAEARYNPAIKAYTYVGAALPAHLEVFSSKPYSYARWVEDELNAEPGSVAEAVPRNPRPEQVEAARAIADAAAAGWRGFLLADDPGLGKTGSAIEAAKAVLRLRGGGTALVTVDRPTAITFAAWRESIAAFGDGGHRWLIMSPDQLKKLLGPNGRPRHHFDVVINDEAQQFRHLSAQRTQYMRRVNKLSADPAKAPFVITLTATPGHHPGEYTYLSPLLAQLHGDPPGEWADLGASLAQKGLPLESGRGTWGWSEEAKASQRMQGAAVSVVREWMTSASPPVMLHRDAPWGQAPVDALPVEFSPQQWEGYHQQWGAFQREMQLARRGRNVARGRAALLRFRQKAGMLRARQTAELVAATVERGYQVLVATELVSTAADPVAELVEEQGIAVARLFGGGDLESERLRFQRGRAQVVVFTTVSAINLQAGELMADGTRATATKRVGFFHQPRYSGIAARQTIGRAHRDYQVCPWSLLYAVGTVEEAAARTMVDRLLVASASVDGDTAALRSIAELFGADWLADGEFD